MSKTTWGWDLWVKERWRDRGLDTVPGSRHWLIAAMGLAGETGEVVEAVLELAVHSGKASELLKKDYRDGKDPGTALKLELGDVLHYLTVIAQSYGWSLEDIMNANVLKLEERDRSKKKASDPYKDFVQPPGYTSDV